MCQGTLGTTRTPLTSCLALAVWHICRSVISSKLQGDTALCSGKPEETTNSKLAALARDLDYFFHISRRRHHRPQRAGRSRCACPTCSPAGWCSAAFSSPTRCATCTSTSTPPPYVQLHCRTPTGPLLTSPPIKVGVPSSPRVGPTNAAQWNARDGCAGRCGGHTCWHASNSSEFVRIRLGASFIGPGIASLLQAALVLHA